MVVKDGVDGVGVVEVGFEVVDKGEFRGAVDAVDPRVPGRFALGPSWLFR
jgi:hypothetical protein